MCSFDAREQIKHLAREVAGPTPGGSVLIARVALASCTSAATDLAGSEALLQDLEVVATREIGRIATDRTAGLPQARQVRQMRWWREKQRVASAAT